MNSDPGEHDREVSEPVKASAVKVDLDQLALDEEERRFLLRSLEDLEKERAAGDIDTTDYEELRADYLARLADVQRRVEGDASALAARRNRVRSTRSKLLPVAAGLATFLFALGAGWLVARTAGERKAGETITGNLPVGEAEKIATLMSEASDASTTDPLLAIRKYDEVTKLEPRVVAAWAYGGWTLRLTAVNIQDDKQRASLQEGALRRLDEAVRQDPTYPDARAFRAVMKLRDFGDEQGAIADLKVLDTIPHDPFIDQLTAGIREELGLPAATPPTT